MADAVGTHTEIWREQTASQVEEGHKQTIKHEATVPEHQKAEDLQGLAVEVL